MADVRIDKYLWAIRAFKTRNEAADACKGGKVKIGQVNAKPSKLVQPGDVLQVRKGAVTYVYKVVQPTEHRVGAKLVSNFAENLTQQAELDKARAQREPEPAHDECSHEHVSPQGVVDDAEDKVEGTIGAEELSHW
jgi:ribosome-associated heat shock protein Hsp15